LSHLIGGSSQASQATQVSGLQIQSSVLGKVIPIGYGTAMLAPNLIWYGDFEQTGGGSGKAGGKGGGGGKSGGSSAAKYAASVVLALGEGPSSPGGTGIIWADKTTGTAGSFGFSVFGGAYSQAPWSYLTANHPGEDLGYSGIIYLAGAAIDLGNSGQLKNYNVEVYWPLRGTAPNGIDADPSQVVVDLLTNGFYGAGFPSSRVGQLTNNSEAHTIPSSPPYQITVANAAGFNQNLDVVDGSGNIFTCVASSPAALQYTFTNGGLYTFNAADAGKSITINYASLGALSTYQAYCLASGLWISPVYTEAAQASSMLDDITTYTNSEWVWSSGVLSIVPRGATSLSGNGYTYTAPSSVLFTLTDDDFLPNVNATGGSSAMNQDPILGTRKRPADRINDIRIEALDRNNQYSPAPIEIYDQAAIDTYGRRADNSRTAHLFCDLNAASVSASLLLQRQAIQNVQQITLDERYAMLDPMDLLDLVDAKMFPNKTGNMVTARVTEITENDDGTLSIALEEYPVGLGGLPAFTLASGTGYAADYSEAPGNANPPAIFEPTAELTDTLGGGSQIWIGLSGGATWGGTQVWMSTDGESYAEASGGEVVGQTRMGVLTAALPAVSASSLGPTIDSANTLAVDISEASGAQLIGGSQADMLAGNTLCWVDGELIAYQLATLTGTGKYSLTVLNRGMYGTTPSAHAAGSVFVRLDGAGFKMPFTPDRIGQTIWFKFLSFNVFGGGQQSLSEVSPYKYTVQGVALSSPLPDVTSLTTAYVGNVTELDWTEVEDFRPVMYEVRYAASGATSPIGAQVLGRVAHPPFTIGADGTYFVAAMSQPIAGLTVYSAQWESITVAGATLNRNIVASYEEDPSWSGTLGGSAALSGSTVVIVNGDFLGTSNFLGLTDFLHLGSFEGSGTYTVPSGHEIDVQRVAACVVSISWSAIGQQQQQPSFLGVSDFLGMTDMLGNAASANVDVYPQIQLSQDGVTWGSWQDYQPGIYSARKFNARMQISSSDPQTEAILESMKFTVDAPDRIDDYIGFSCAAGGSTLTFTPNGSGSAAPFNGGPGGASLPQLQVTILGEVAGDIVVLSGESLSQVTIQIKNGGTGVARTLNVLAKGY